MIDTLRLKSDTWVRLADGSLGRVTGSYMSVTGIALTVNVGGGIVDRNVPISEIVEIVEL